MEQQTEILIADMDLRFEDPTFKTPTLAPNLHSPSIPHDDPLSAFPRGFRFIKKPLPAYRLYICLSCFDDFELPAGLAMREMATKWSLMVILGLGGENSSVYPKEMIRYSYERGVFDAKTLKERDKNDNVIIYVAKVKNKVRLEDAIEGAPAAPADDVTGENWVERTQLYICSRNNRGTPFLSKHRLHPDLWPKLKARSLKFERDELNENHRSEFSWQPVPMLDTFKVDLGDNLHRGPLYFKQKHIDKAAEVIKTGVPLVGTAVATLLGLPG